MCLNSDLSIKKVELIKENKPISFFDDENSNLNESPLKNSTKFKRSPSKLNLQFTKSKVNSFLNNVILEKCNLNQYLDSK